MKYQFTSVLSSEMNGYLALLRQADRYIDKIQSSLKSFDYYLNEHNHKDKDIKEEVVSSWIAEKPVKIRTKAGILYNLKGFARYLSSLGFKASIPEIPIVKIDYVPYVFSKDEFIRMVSIADNYGWGKISQRYSSSKVFPVLLRILYGCGLRLCEGLSLRWKDIDLETGIITILEGKNTKQKLVPMSNSLTEILLLYKEKMQFEKVCSDYLFESSYIHGKPFIHNTFSLWFSLILKQSDIFYSKQTPHEM